MSYFHRLPRHLFTPPQGPLPGVHFRRAREADAESLSKSCYAHRSKSQFQDEFGRSLRAQRAGNRVHLLALSQDTAVGSAQLIVRRRSDAHSVEIADLIVHEPYRDRGIGTALIGILERIAAHAGFNSVEIGVMAHNQRALALYKRLGFDVKGEIALPDGARALILHKASAATAPP